MTLIPNNQVGGWLAQMRRAMATNEETATYFSDAVGLSYHAAHHLPPREAEYAQMRAFGEYEGGVVPIQLEIAPGAVVAADQVRLLRGENDATGEYSMDGDAAEAKETV